MAIYNKNIKGKSLTIQEVYKIYQPREYSDKHRGNTHREITPIGDTLSTLLHLQKEREGRKGKITFSHKGTSNYLK